MGEMMAQFDTALTPEQLDWFKARRDIIWLADYWASQGDLTSLTAFGDYSRTSPDWRWLFGSITWDEAFKRYKHSLIGKN